MLRVEPIRADAADSVDIETVARGAARVRNPDRFISTALRHAGLSGSWSDPLFRGIYQECVSRWLELTREHRLRAASISTYQLWVYFRAGLSPFQIGQKEGVEPKAIADHARVIGFRWRAGELREGPCARCGETAPLITLHYYVCRTCRGTDRPPQIELWEN